jgi:hypothetical protein
VRDIGTIFERKFNTFKSDPLRSTTAKIKSIVPWVINRWGRHKLHENGALSVLVEFAATRPRGAFNPDFADLWFLYRMVRKRKPRTILEFGSGCSTVILAKALFDNRRDAPAHVGYLYSVDADPAWTEATARSIPSSVRDFCAVSYSPVLEVEYSGTPGFRHARIPDISPNFVYLDGPPLTPQRQVAVDILDMEIRLPQDFFLVIDGRKENTTFLRQHLKRRYAFKQRRIFDNPVFTLVD